MSAYLTNRTSADKNSFQLSVLRSQVVG